MNPGRAAARASSSAPRTCSPAASGTTISGPVSAPSAAAAWRRLPVTRAGLPVLIACPARAGQRRCLVYQSRGQRAADACHDHLIRFMGDGQHREVRVRGGRGMLGDQRVRLLRLAGQQQGHQLAGGVQPAAALFGLGVPPRVGDRRAGGCGERVRQLLIVRGELAAGAALSEVEVAEDFLADADRDAEEAAHRRVSRRESRRRAMGAEVSKPDRDRLAGQQAQDPPAPGQVTDPRDHLFVHAGVHELLQLPVTADNAKRRVPGAEKTPGRLHDLPQHHRQAQIPGYQRIRAQPALRDGRRTGSSCAGGTRRCVDSRAHQISRGHMEERRVRARSGPVRP